MESVGEDPMSGAAGIEHGVCQDAHQPLGRSTLHKGDIGACEFDAEAARTICINTGGTQVFIPKHRPPFSADGAPPLCPPGRPHPSTPFTRAPPTPPHTSTNPSPP